MSILEKKIRSLTEKDRKALYKPLGVRGRPYPMRDMVLADDTDGGKTLVNRLGVLEDNENPLVVWSERGYADVVGMAMREMPTPGMLPLFFDALARRDPVNKRRIQFLKGAAGAGKTFMSELIGRMRTDKGALKVDCSNLNLGELLYETVLDFNASRTFYAELDKRLASGNVNALSVRLLEDALGDAFHRDARGKISIDWGVVGKNGVAEASTQEGVERALSALRRVSQLEGLDAAGGNTLGMATQEGPLIRAWKEGREIILDEFNRGKRGTTGVLHGVLQLIIGEIDECTVTNTLKEKGDDTAQSFTFRRSDLRTGFFVTLTGNTETDGTDVEELPQSLNSRIIPQHVPLATLEDWQHRICQLMTGLPISTIYHSNEAQWKNDPDGFRRQLIEWRTLSEPRAVPELQMRLLNRWEDVLEASERLAKFYYGWSQVVDPDSAVHRSGSLAALLEELDDSYKGEVSVDFRKITAHLAEAMEQRPSIRNAGESQGYDIGKWDTPPKMGKQAAKEDPAVSFGSRLVNVILKHVVSDTAERGKHSLYAQLQRYAVDCGLLPARLLEGKPSERRSVSDLLNDNPYFSKKIDVQADLIRNLLCDYLRERYEGLSEKTDDIISLHSVRRAMDAILAADDQADEMDVPALFVFNDDPETLNEMPLIDADCIDTVPDADDADQAEMAQPEPQALVSARVLLATLSSPILRQQNLQALFTQALSRSGVVMPDSEQSVDEGLAMAENRSETGVAVTTIAVAQGEGDQVKAVPLHIIWNSRADSVLVVGEGEMSSSLKNAFRASNLYYVDRSEKSAKAQTKAALSRVLGGEVQKLENQVRNAILMRNMLDDAEAEKGSALGELLARKDLRCFLPQYAVKASAQPKVA